MLESLVNWSKQKIIPSIAALSILSSAYLSPVYAGKLHFHKSPPIKVRLQTIDYLVIHCTGGPTAASALAGLDDRKLSIHYLIERDGKVIKLYSENLVALHAGKSKIRHMNNRSIGIELVNWGEVRKRRDQFYCGHKFKKDYDSKVFDLPYSARGTWWAPYPPKQIDAVINLSVAILKRHPTISLHHIIGHEDINPSKQDPGGAFDWQMYRSHINVLLQQKKEKEHN